MAENETAANSARTIDIDVVSDVMCPWCYLGKKNLEAAAAQLDGIELRIAWRPFQLDPTLPQAGKDRRKYLEDKFGSVEKIRPAHDRLVEMGANAGISYDFDAIEVAPNTLDAHRVIRWAGGIGPEVQEKVVGRLFALYFEEGANIGDPEVLARAAGEAGMDEALVRELLASDRDKAEVEAEIGVAQRIGVTGVPCFIIDHKQGLMGAQPPQVLAQAIRQAAAIAEPAK
jgi:predicted DsbA family dithiol-disulfide isomerase